MCTSGSSSDLDAMLVHVRGFGPVVACKCRRDRARQLESTGTRMSRTIGGGASVCQELDTGSTAPPRAPSVPRAPGASVPERDARSGSGLRLRSPTATCSGTARARAVHSRRGREQPEKVRDDGVGEPAALEGHARERGWW